MVASDNDSKIQPKYSKIKQTRIRIETCDKSNRNKSNFASADNLHSEIRVWV